MPTVMVGLPLALQRLTGEASNVDTHRGIRMILRNIAVTVGPVALICRSLCLRGWVDLRRTTLRRTLLEVAATLAMVDTIFYAAHRALHTKLLYAWHRTHHSFRPTQTTCYVAMSLPEFVCENLVYFLLAPVLGRLWGRIHLCSWALANLYVLLHGTAIHNATFDFDLSHVGINSPPQHQLHHRYGQRNANFSLLFTFWDRLFGTFVPQPGLARPGLARPGRFTVLDNRPESFKKL